MTTYVTTAELQAQPGMGSVGEAEAEALILRAEDIADELLGNWAPDDTTGRKIVEADADAWRWDRLQRFVLGVAVRLHTNPTATDGGQWSSVSGPDFSFSGPSGAGWEQRLGAELVGVLNGSGLRRLTGSVTGRRSYSSAAAYWDDTNNWDDYGC